MKTFRKINVLSACLVLASSFAFVACSQIDDDNSDCEIDFQGSYRMSLITNEELEIKRVLGDSLNGIAVDLREHLKDVFIDYGRDINMAYYALPDSVATQPLRGSLPTEMNAIERSFEVFMPIYDYMHTVTANLQGNGPVALENASSCHGARLSVNMNEINANDVTSHRTGIYSGRKLLTGMTFGPQRYDFNLYMVNCADAIILDPRTAQFTNVEVFTHGFANSFSVCDSVYHYDYNTVVRSDRVNLRNTNWLGFCSVNLPSKEPTSYTRLRQEVDEPFFRYDDSGEDIWFYDCRVTMANGSITRTLLSIRHPLRAGQLKIILGYIDDEGVVRIYDAEVGTSIDLDWEPSYVFHPFG